jgi:UDP-perosamine 4-acetyltransferase
VTAVIGLGAGGHAKVVIEILRAAGGFDVVGLLDPREDLWGKKVLGVPVLGGDDLLERQYDEGVRSVFIGLGGSSDTRPRRRLYDLARARGFDVVSAVHPAAHVAPTAALGAAATVAAAAVVGVDVETGENVVVNTGAVVEHDCSLGSHVHVASGARLGGGVFVGDGGHIGLGASVNPGLRVGEGAVVGAGAVVVEDVEPDTVVIGVPARPLRKVAP